MTVIDQRAADRILDGIVGPALLRDAVRVETAAKRLCPVDTGRLRASIRHAPGEDSEGPYVDVGSDVTYAIFVEEGTRHTRAQPYLRPALRQVRP